MKRLVIIVISLHLWSLTAAQLELKWIDAATGESSYTVQWSKESDYAPLLGSVSLGANTETYTITGLENNTLYFVRVFASNAKGDSDFLDGRETTLPATPSSLAASNASGNKVNLSWVAPASGADSYKVEYKKAVDSTWTEFASGVTDTSDIVGGLDEETLYDFRVRGTSAGGDGEYSNTASVTTGAALPPLLIETFEGAETVSGGSGTADNPGWIANNAACNFDYDTSPLAGGNSFQSTDRNYFASHPISPVGTEIWIYFRLKGGNASSLEENLLIVNGESGNCMRVTLRSAFQEIYIRHGTVSSTENIDNWPGASADFSIERHVLIQWEKGTGTNGTMRMWTSSDVNFGAEAEREITTGNGIYIPAIVHILGGSAAIIDNLYISENEIKPPAPSALRLLNP